MALGVLSGDAIGRAIAEYDELGRDAFLSKHGFGRATTYALVVDGREYDPKAIAGVAYGIDHPDRGTLKNTEFNGGLQLRSAFRPAGFDVVLRTNPGEVALRDLIERFMLEYPEARLERFSGAHAVQATLRSLTDVIAQSSPLRARPDVVVKGSVGLGNWAAAPWIALLDGRLTSTTQSGVYVVLLFREDMSGVYVTVAQGTQELKQQGRSHMLAALERTAGEVRDLVDPELEKRFFTIDSDIRLGQGALARDYEASVVVHKLYERGAVPEDAAILADLDAVLDLTDALAEAIQVPDKSSSLSEVAAAFREAVDASGLQTRSGHGDPVLALVAALATKPFAILSGLSGSGKTQLALRLGEWFGSGPYGRRFLPVAVRPDWTGPEALFGYEDALRPPRDGKAAWFVPATLDFLLKAAKEPDMPYLLLLDEMNLAHVERYFSDFLSGMETRDAVLPNLSRGADGEWRVRSSVEPLIAIPRNVFVIGTVNVDETTYQFSPKVLDRATTFEVRTATAELVPELVRPSAVAPADVAPLRAFVNFVLDDTWQAENPSRLEVADALRDLHARLTATDDEFGHRVFYESLRLAGALHQLGVTERNKVLDHIVLLKVLPKIHGSRRRAEPVLEALVAFATDPDGPHDGDDVEPAGAALPMTAEKLWRMRRAAAINQFVSFTD
jgi:5-methylcytosine-specific restriction enzyme B